MIAILIITYILNVIDYLETAYIIKYYGTYAEGNPIMRYFFENNCALGAKLIVPAILLTIIGLIVKIDRTYIWAPCVLFAFYLYLVIHNFAIIVQAGLI